MVDINFTKICGVAIALRLVLLVYGEWQDANMTVKYTDIDYLVFTDASRFVTEGKSPYERATYRYTPLLAILLTPNIFLHKAFGKCLFVIADIVVGILIGKILQRRGLNQTKITFYTSLWLLNPVVANISTRGNAESLIGAMVLGFLYCLLTKRLYLGSFLFGLSVHFKMYPIIYALPGLMLLDDNFDTTKGKRRAVLNENNSWLGKAVDFVNKKRILFGLVSGSVFLLLNAMMYYL
ncbi:GPI mannosyltransferase 1 [Basidiobolus ranarum]|uniref:GPI mannosyltransferase 1 n=1 Tax=Basidiobolus ranarum TaxID=34480 RepID=A0ABR2W121_9FUNG